MGFSSNQAVSAAPGEVTRRQRDQNWKTDWNLQKELPPDPHSHFNLIGVTESRREKDEAGFIDQVILA